MLAFQSLIVCVLLSAVETEAFGVQSATVKRIHRPVFLDSSRTPILGTTTTRLYVGSSWHASPDEHTNSLMQHARECASSDSCSLHDAQLFLQEVLLRIQDEASTTTANSQDDDDIMEIVTKLQEKIRVGKGIIAESLRETPLFGGMVMPLGLILFCSVALLPLVDIQGQDSVPLTFQEWWWATRDGYLTTMFVHYIRNGGL